MNIVDIKALQLAARFALPPNSLGYCGKNTAPERLKDCVINGECKDISEELSKFIVLNPYLETLAKILKTDKFSYSLIEAYCLGNDELRKIKQEDYQILLEAFVKQGVPSWLVEELKNDIPKKFIPFHLFQVLHVGVGRASGSVPFNMETINNCMVRWGVVTKVDSWQLTVDLNSLIKNKLYKLTTIQEKFDYRKDFLPGIKMGDIVAVHWKQVVKILNKKEVENLSYWTNQVLRFQAN
jgi:hypothetical protein